MVIPPFGLRVIRQMLQPRPYSGGIRQPPMRLSFPGANFYRHSLQLINDAESRLVGQIIADKNRFAAGEWRLLHERGNRLPFVDAAGFNLHHALAKL